MLIFHSRKKRKKGIGRGWDQRNKMKLELTEGDSQEVSKDTPMHNPHIIPLNKRYKFILRIIWWSLVLFLSIYPH